MRPSRWRAAFLVSLSLGCSVAAGQEPSQEVASSLGRRISEFTLNDVRGEAYSLGRDEAKPLVVVCFLGTECPLSNLYAPRLQTMAERYGPRGVAFLAISANVQDSVTELSAYVRDHGLTFPMLKDLGNHVADQLGATRTPEVFVLDRDRVVRYLGRVDAQYSFGSGVGLARPAPQRDDLAIALDELLAGRAVTVPVTEPRGCLIGRVRPAKTNSPVTYANQIARLIQDRCLQCHRPGQIAPFALTDYEEVAGWGEMIAEVVRQQRMPPWHANPAYGKFANENRLSEAEKQLIATWVENGCPEGDRSQLPPPREFAEGWLIPRAPDQVVYMAEQPVAVKAEGVEPYRFYTVDPGFTTDRWVTAMECRPGNRAVVHHIIVFIKPPGTGTENRPEGRGEGESADMPFLSGFAPGTRPQAVPQGWARKIPAGSKLVFQMHYTPTGTPQEDRSCIGLVFAEEHEVTHQWISKKATGRQLAIPPYEPDYSVEADSTFGRDEIVLSLFPHMHMRGKAFRYELITPGAGAGARADILLDIPRYDFNWQTWYVLAEPRRVPAGSVLHCTAHFDNSKDNLANPDPTKTVRWGPQTWEEMMIGWYDVGVPLADRKAASGDRALNED